MKESISISVVIAVYNTEKYIAEAIESIFAQNYSNIEIIVVNDGSTDNTLKILEQYSGRIKIISQENKGQSVARNVGIKQAKGTLIGFIDADDLWAENYILNTIKYLSADSVYDYVYGQTKYFRIIDGKKEMTDNLCMKMLIGASLFKKKVFDIVGLFNEEMREGEDLDWFFRLMESHCKGKKIEETMLFYRRHENNISNPKDRKSKSLLNAYREKAKRNKIMQNNYEK